MVAPHQLRTERLLLRQWRPEDRAPFAALNADKRVREHFPSLLSNDKSDELAGKLEREIAERGYGFWAVEVPGVTPFAGFVGLSMPDFKAHFTPSVEIGWRLAWDHWGQGYATEAARAAVAFAFGKLQLPELVSYTVPANVRSRWVMEKLGFTRRAEEDFDHPALGEGHPMRRHVLYRLSREQWAPA
ncbi:MAG: GNAT family N-acetyltransferase [Myxococcaceae bacterium]|nr:GNAT family N-acetyltransferase [Myxococcaceae bacterium]